jgi:hypothetical protein
VGQPTQLVERALAPLDVAEHAQVAFGVRAVLPAADVVDD